MTKSVDGKNPKNTQEKELIKAEKLFIKAREVFQKEIINNNQSQKIKNLLEETTNLLKDKIILRNYLKNLTVSSKERVRISLENSKQFINKNLINYPQNWIEKRIKGNYQEVILTQSQVWTRALIWTLSGGTVFGLVWLSIAKTDEIVIATGMLEPIQGVVDVQIPLQGVASDIYVKEGDLVEKGQLLIKLDTESINAKTDAYSESLTINEKIANKLDILVKEGAVSEFQYLQQKNKISELKSKIVESEVILKYQRILAPISGKIFDLKPFGAGYVARSTEPILKIVPTDNLQAKIEVSSRNIGFVSVGKKADISIDSFPSSDFGVIEGEIISIGSDALPPDPRTNKGYRFPSKIKLSEQTLILKNGKTLPLQPGMSLTANIKLRKVSYLQLLLGTFQQKADSLRQI